ncbi:MAG: hypothetical protein HYT21_00590 [Candidatus Nealsonbacteria bacterium]|nr:hypothetical protein [Candidatus Nealsonbacteria bacterium]
MDVNQASNDNDRMGKMLFYLCAILTVWWMYVVTIEALGRNFYGHNVVWEMTSLWASALTIYVGRKNVTNWGKKAEGRFFGEYFAGAIVVYAAIIFALYIHFGWVKIPEQLTVGVQICLGLLGTNEITKSINQRKIEKAEKNGNSSS